MRLLIYLGLTFFTFVSGGYLSLVAQNVFINEIMCSNIGIVLDEYSLASDWVEIYNRSTTAIDLKGYFLSDSPSNLQKWAFPNTSIPAQGYLLIFASGKGPGLYAKYWETIIDWGDEWRYFPGSSEPPPNWNLPGFEDENWNTGNSGFGYGDNDDATLIEGVLSIYVRKEFILQDLQNIRALMLHIDADDGFVAYLNGKEIARKNLFESGCFVAYNQTSQYESEALFYQGGLPKATYKKRIKDYLVEGTNVLAIQVHNVSLSSDDLSLIPILSLGMDKAPANPAGVPFYIHAHVPRIHSNFKLSTRGETLCLSDSLGNIIDQKSYNSIPYPLSYGRKTDSDSLWCFTNRPSPEKANQIATCMGLCPAAEFSKWSGFYSDTLSLSLSGNNKDETIYFTTDGKIPTTQSSVYTSPIVIRSTSIIRARILSPNKFPGKTVSHSYFINQSFDLPVISISTNPNNLWDPDTGMLVLGKNASNEIPHFGANFWQDWERPVHIDFFEQDGDLAFSIDAGMKVHGGWTRAYPQKSLAVFFRKKYGYNNLNYQVFPSKPIDKFENLVFRNSGNDCNVSMFRDGMMTSLIGKLDIDIQAFRPAIVLLNGEYYGIENIREKTNEHFIAANHPLWDKDNIDLLELENTVIVGDNLNYNLMIEFIKNNPLSVQANYEEVKTRMDVENFALYQLTNIYFANVDWPGNNIKFWRPRTFDGKFRWIVFDTDVGFNLLGSYDFNSLEMALDPNNQDSALQNPPWSTFLLRNLITNEEFKNMFVNRFADCLNYTFHKDTVFALIDSLQGLIKSSIPLYTAKYGGSPSRWENKVESLRKFAMLRVSLMRNYIAHSLQLVPDIEKSTLQSIKIGLSFIFGFHPSLMSSNFMGLNFSELNLTNCFSDVHQINNGMYNLWVSAKEPNSGNIHINSLTLDNFPWKGVYFQEVPVKIFPEAKPGFIFKGWTGDTITNSDTLTISPNSNFSVTANFIPGANPQAKLVINEFLAINTSDTTDNFGEHEDWIEIYNPGNSPIDMEGYYFSDDLLNPGKWRIESATNTCTIAPMGYKLFWADKDPGQGNNHLNFKLSAKGEDIVLSRFIDGEFKIYDSVSFGPQNENISKGRTIRDSNRWEFFTIPTPGAKNTQ